MLMPDKTRTEHGLRICEKIIPYNAVASRTIADWCRKGWPMKPRTGLTVQGVTVHNTTDLAGVADDAEQYTRATWPNCNMGGVVVHYYVDDTGAWQNLREDEQGWHASDGKGPGNTATLAVEIIMDGSGSMEDKRGEENGALLCAVLLRRHVLGIDRLYTHNHWMGLPDKLVPGARKNCPLYILPHWEAFRAKVQGCLEQIGKEETTMSTMKGVRYIGDFASKVEAEMVAAFVRRGKHTCEVVPFEDKWGVLVSELARNVTVERFSRGLLDFADIYSCDPVLKKIS